MSVLLTKSVSTNVDNIGQINNGATDTNTISITNTTHFPKWYGTLISQGLSDTDIGELSVRVKFGSTVIARGMALGCLAALPVHHGVIAILPPSGTHIQGAAGEDIVIEVENLAGSGSAENVQTVTYYSEEKVTKGN